MVNMASTFIHDGIQSVCRSMMESKLMSGTTLIVDRYSYSGVAFSSAKGLDFEWCKVKKKYFKLILDLVSFSDSDKLRSFYSGPGYRVTGSRCCIIP